MRNVALRLSFLGTNYCGFQRQKNGFSIQEALENAILETTKEFSRITGCSRTDAGVHANEFVINFKTNSRIPNESFPLALNSRLPGDLSILSARDVPEDFSARFDCRKKEYVYKMYESKIRDPFLENRALQIVRPLDLNAAGQAAKLLTGTQDFEAFAAAGRTTKTTVRTIYSFEVEKNGREILFRVSGDGFLYNMVRIMTGTLLFVGSGKLSPAEVLEILKSKERRRAGPTAPPYGLYLNRVFYDSEEI